MASSRNSKRFGGKQAKEKILQHFSFQQNNFTELRFPLHAWLLCNLIIIHSKNEFFTLSLCHGRYWAFFSTNSLCIKFCSCFIMLQRPNISFMQLSRKGVFWFNIIRLTIVIPILVPLVPKFEEVYYLPVVSIKRAKNYPSVTIF